MQYRPIKQEERKDYFDFLSKMMKGQEIQIEVIGLDVGDQIEEAWTCLEGLSYDPLLDILHIHTDPADHVICRPLDVLALEDGLALKSLCAMDSDEHLRILNFRELPRLEAPEMH